ncbi:CAAX metallo endopeptidase, partial [Toxoplasma gondii TgCatPRC2]
VLLLALQPPAAAGASAGDRSNRRETIEEEL